MTKPQATNVRTLPFFLPSPAVKATSRYSVRKTLWLFVAILIAGCAPETKDRRTLLVVNQSETFLNRVTIWDDGAKEGRRVMNIPPKGEASRFPLGLPLRGSVMIAVLKGENEWFESSLSLEKFRADANPGDYFVVYVGDRSVSVATGATPSSPMILEVASMTRSKGPIE